MDILKAAADLLSDANFSTKPIAIGDRQALAFEDTTILGFLFAYGKLSELLERWNDESPKAISAYRFALRRADQKAWNTYIVLLAAEEAGATASWSR